MAGLTLRDVAKSYGDVQVIESIDLDIEDGEFVVFVGPSGCGKSTLLRMIAGLEEISGGDVSIGDRLVNDVAPAKRGVAMVFQTYALYPHMTVYKNMAFGLKQAKMPADEIDQRVREAAAILDITDYLDRTPKALSGGQRQRVAIGRAIVREPEVFLFDEPLSNLDAALRVQTRLEIARLHERLGSTMIYVTHDQVEAMTLASRIVVLAGGGIAQVGSPLELYERPENEFVAQFIGSPSMNLLAGKITGTGEQTTIEVEGGGIAVSNYPSLAEDMGKDVNIGVRPEDFVPAGDGDSYIYHNMVNITEALGEVTLLHFAAEGEKEPVIGKLQGIHRELRGKDVRLTADPSKVHVFMNTQSLLYRDRPIKNIATKTH